MAKNQGRGAGPRQVGDLLSNVISRLGLRRDLDDYRIFEAWDRVVGAQIAQQAQPVRLDSRRLVVHVRSAVWLQELSLMRNELRQRINEWMGREIVTDLFLVLGPVEENTAKRRRPS